MTSYSYTEVVKKAKTVQENIKTKYKTDVHNKWGYYFAKALTRPKMEVPQRIIASAPKPSGDTLGRQIKKDDISAIAKHIVEFAESRNRMPNFVTFQGKHIRVRDYINMMSYCLVFQSKNGRLPNFYNINSKAFIKPTETGNTVFDYWVKKFGFKPSCIDDVCDYIMNHFDYEYYFDDHKSNKEVIDSKAGNCTDLSQMLSNMADALGYDWKCIHTQCKQSGTGHVYLKLKKNGDWFIRDVACIADESDYCVWCNVDTGAGNLLAENPAWWMENRQR